MGEGSLSVQHRRRHCGIVFSAAPEFNSMFSQTPSNLAAANENSTWSFESLAQACLPGVALLVVLSSAYQYISQFSNKAARHKQSAVEFANLRRKIERYSVQTTIHPEAVHALNRTYNSVAKHHPLVPDKIWDNSKKKASDELEVLLEFFEENSQS